MSPEHDRLSNLLLDAAQKHGSRAALARALELDRSQIGALINGKRYVTITQALKIEKVLGVSARELLIEAATSRIDEELSKARARS